MPEVPYILIALGVFALSVLSVAVIRTVALRKALLDTPNERSSHKIPVPRLGGAAFVPVVLMGVSVLWWPAPLPWGVKIAYGAGVIALFLVSLLDDFYTLSTGKRFVVQFAVAGAAVVAVLWAQPVCGAAMVEIALGASLVVGVVGLLNVYNFMDGIDGIAGLQGVVAGLAWWGCAWYLGAPAAGSLGLVLAAGAMGFLTLNWPPAKIFMGDAGSTVLGFSFAVLPLLVWVEAKPPSGFFSLLVVGLLLVWPFWADGAFTILRRLRKRENILKAHRSHLYQRLVIAGKSHQTVTVVYGALAVIGAFLAWPIMRGYPWAVPLSGCVILASFGLLWRWTVASENRALARP